ncbi:hypothetical protein PR048_033654 [Dryococelus australis]|uniref:Type II inositol 3,4-bisphosphate 4-phosphatase n=1 Tax=Dryococelus australis TaxID=614101 RepID=A0ABQ9G0W9_9NEOP|nr:hypothetical protein PR048_033654 [Dryococelus australis]
MWDVCAGSFFKPSSRKHDRVLEFAPVNLHLQRLWVQNETLRKSGFYDVVTVGAFTAHSHKSKNGGLVKYVHVPTVINTVLLQQLKESPTKNSLFQRPNKIMMAHDAIQAIKQLRREVVDGMRALMKLAKEKQTAGMLPICEDMISKTRILLSLWDPGLVEEALVFVDEHKLAQTLIDDIEEVGSCQVQTVSPFKRITQQLNFEFKSPDLDDLATPDSPWCTQNFWSLPVVDQNRINEAGSLKNHDGERKENKESPTHDTQFVIFPEAEEDWKDNEDNSNLKENTVNNNEDDPVVTKLSNNNVISKELEYDLGRRFLDTQVMCSSPSANYYKPTDEPEPWDLIQLNIEASVMCLVSKVKFLCGRCGSPAVRLRSRSFRSGLCSVRDGKAVVTIQPVRGKRESSQSEDVILTADMTSDEVLDKAVDSVQRAVNSAVNSAVARNGSTVQRNKFTEGLDFASIVDWTCELRPSMRKLRQAMDGLLKTARLTHSVFRVQEDSRAAQRACNVRYRRDVCFSQALTSLVTGLMAKLWCQKPDPAFLAVLSVLGPLVSFEGLLSYYGDEIDMWGDMIVAVEDLATVTFMLVRCNAKNNRYTGLLPTSMVSSSSTPDLLPRVCGSRVALTVLLPVSDAVHSLLPLTSSATVSFHITPVFFNVGINEMATLAESLGNTRPQEKSNLDNYERLNEYYHRFRKLDLHLPSESPGHRGPTCGPLQPSLADLVDNLKTSVHSRQNKNVDILHLSAQICRRMKGTFPSTSKIWRGGGEKRGKKKKDTGQSRGEEKRHGRGGEERGLRFTSCKSSKDRTGMSVTLEQCHILLSEYDLAEHEFQRALDCMRRFVRFLSESGVFVLDSEGCRRENTCKNAGVRKYAFNSLQLLTLPKLYRPPAGTYGSAQT